MGGIAFRTNFKELVIWPIILFCKCYHIAWSLTLLPDEFLKDELLQRLTLIICMIYLIGTTHLLSSWSCWISILVSVPQRNQNNSVYLWKEIPRGIKVTALVQNLAGVILKKTNASVSVWSPEKTNIPTQAVLEEEFPLTTFFTFSIDWLRPTHLREEASLLSLPIQVLISSRTILADRIMFGQMFQHPMAQSRCHIKLAITVQVNTIVWKGEHSSPFHTFKKSYIFLAR